MPDDGIEFQADGMTEPGYVSTGSCGQLSSEAVPPINVTEGETVTISLDYSIEGIVTEDCNSTSCVDVGSSGTKRCISLPQFKPSATKG